MANSRRWVYAERDHFGRLMTGSPAPELQPGLDWINVERPLSLRMLKGKLVVLDFWTYG